MSRQPPPRPKVLVVDDDAVSRAVLSGFLRKDYDVREAPGGVEAMDELQRLRATGDDVDLVLLDIQMPVMNGFEVARAMKALDRGRFLPIVLMTADNDEARLAAGLDAGADDFVTKPVSRAILLGKIEALRRVSGLMWRLRDQNDELSYFREKAQRDFAIARRVFDTIANRSVFARSHLQPHLQPLEYFNGDLLMAAPVSATRLRLFLGDFTGHGLPAALGALPVSDTFYAMTALGLPIEALVREVNLKLRRLLPPGIFLSACVLDLDAVEQRIAFWNGGIPEALVLDRAGRVRTRLPSTELPLGVLPDSDLSTASHLVDLRAGDQLFLYTDGLIEISNPTGELFGLGRVEDVLASTPAADAMNTLLGAANAFQGDSPPTDDVTFLLMPLSPEELGRVSATAASDASNPIRKPLFTFEFLYGPQDLRSSDPLELAMLLIEKCSALAADASAIFTVVGELFSNAIEHGLLDLDSAMKHTPEGFARYYELRRSRLAVLREGWIRLTIKVFGDGPVREALVRVEDSGRGFDVKSETKTLGSITTPSGRGLALLRELCASLRILDAGRTAEATVVLRGAAESDPESIAERPEANAAVA